MTETSQHDVWKPSGIVSLISDFGTLDPYVGIMKGVVATVYPAARCIDLTHQVPPQNVRAAAFYLEHSWGYFPSGTVHLAVVDPGVGTGRNILVVRHADHVFLAPDNGLLEPILSAGGEAFALDIDRFSRPNRSRTFHGRDVFSPAAAQIAGGLNPADAGTPTFEPMRLPVTTFPRDASDRLDVEVLLVDHFGNAVLSVCSSDLGVPADWTTGIGDESLRVVQTYADVRPGEAALLINSYDHLEIAVRDGDAARRFGLAGGDRLQLVKSLSASQ